MKRAFTLIELLVVISIISLLASVVLAAVNTARLKAQISKAKQEMVFFANAVGIASGESFKTLLTMSQNGGASIPNCSVCACGTGSLAGTTSTCYTDWVAVLNGVQSNSNGLITNLTTITRDPWGSPYLVDQNQGEAGNCAPTSPDTLYSAGPDTIKNTSDDVISPIPIPFPPRCP